MDIDTERELERFGLKDGQKLERSETFLTGAKLYVDYNSKGRFAYLGQGDIGKQNLEKIKGTLKTIWEETDKNKRGMFLITDGGGGITRVEKEISINHLKYIVIKDMIFYVFDIYHDNQYYDKDGHLKEYLLGKRKTLLAKDKEMTVYEIEKSCFVIVQGHDFSHKRQEVEESSLKLIALTFDQAKKIIMGF